MKAPEEVIINPIVSEKTMRLIEEENTYCFKVAEDSNKVEIGKAIEKLFDVEVENVNTINMRGKKRSLGRQSEGKRPDWKKAYITLSRGDRIEVVEGV